MTLRRTGPPQRRTPLKPGRPIARKVPLPRCPTEPAGRKPVPARRPAPPDIPVAMRRMVIARATDEGGVVRCDRCGGPIIGQYSVHHRDPRGMGGSRYSDPHRPANLILVDGSGTTGCHGHIESRSPEVYEQGFLVRGSVRVPEDVPIFRHLSDWVIPGDGVWIPVAPPIAA